MLNATHLPDKILARIDFTDTCWVWQGSVSREGYGYVWHERKLYHTHRVIYELLERPIPAGLHIDHLCRNPSCVNPAHMEPVTPRENTLRGIGPAATNARKQECHRGHPLSGDNLYVYPRTGYRKCMACQKEQQKRDREAKQKARTPA